MGLVKTNSFGKVIKKGFLVREDNGEVIAFQFNPSQWTEEYTAIYSTVDSPGSLYPEINYSGQGSRKIPLVIYADGIGYDVDVEKVLKSYIKLTLPSDLNVNLYGGKTFAEPPRCSFVWGKSTKKVVVTSAKLIRTMFDRKLNTTVAEINLELLEFTE